MAESDWCVGIMDGAFVYDLFQHVESQRDDGLWIELRESVPAPVSANWFEFVTAPVDTPVAAPVTTPVAAPMVVTAPVPPVPLQRKWRIAHPNHDREWRMAHPNYDHEKYMARAGKRRAADGPLAGPRARAAATAFAVP